MPLDGQQVSNIIDRVKEILPNGDHDRIAEIIYRAVARKIVETGPSEKCFPGFRVVVRDQDYDPGITYFRLMYVHEDGSQRYHSIIAIPDEKADEFAGHFGTCKCHTA
jgi:hypothetical protein